MNQRKLLRSAGALVATLLLSCTSAQAQLFRAYLASDGSDANPCTLPLPCRHLPAALTAVASGGEIWMLDSANYNTGQVNVTKSVTILAIPGAVGSVVATGGGDGININAASVTVTLRNLVLVHLGSSSHGVHFVQGAALHVEDCEIANLTNRGIRAIAPNSLVTIRNTVLRGGFVGFSASGLVQASLDGVHSKGNTYGIIVEDPARVTLTNSVLSGNTYGAYAAALTGTLRLVIERSVLTGNSQHGVSAQTTAAGGAAYVTLSRNTISHNPTAGVHTHQASSSVVNVVANDNVVAENGIGLNMGGTPPGTIYTRGNNTFKFNTNDVMGGTLTALAAQ